MRNRLKPKPLFFLFLASLVLCPNGFAVAAQQTTDLLGVLELASQHDAEYQQTLNALAARETALKRSITRLRPQVNLTGDLTHSQSQTDTPTTGSITRKGTSRVVALNLSQTLFDIETLNNHQQSQVALTALEAERLQAEQTLLTRVITAYLEMLLSREDQHLADQQASTLQQQLKQAQERFKVGLVSVTDVLDAQAQFDLAEVERLQAHNQLSLSKENLWLITGQRPEHLNPLKTSDLPEKILPLPYWLERATINSPTLRIARANLEQAQLQLKLARKAYVPSVALVGRLSDTQGYQSGFDQPDQTNTSLGLQVELPLYLGGAIRSGLKEASQLLVAQREAMRLAQMQTERDMTTLYYSAQTAAQRVLAQQKALTSATSALEATQTGYRSGTRNIIDVLLAQQARFNTERNFAKSRFDLVKGLVALERGAGTLTKDTANTINQWLEPQP